MYPIYDIYSIECSVRCDMECYKGRCGSETPTGTCTFLKSIYKYPVVYTYTWYMFNDDYVYVLYIVIFINILYFILYDYITILLFRNVRK